MPLDLTLGLASLVPPMLMALVLDRTPAIIASIVLVIIVIIAWKFLKFAFRIALIIVVAALIFWALKAADIL